MTARAEVDGRTSPLEAAEIKGRRIVVVGLNYAPEHTGIAPYTTQACRYLADAGAEVLVLAGVPHYPHWSVPPPYRWRLRRDESHDGVQVRRLRHSVPRTQSAAKRATYEATFGAHVLVSALPWRPDLVVAVVPSLLGAAAAAALARKHGAPLALWLQDLMGPAAAQSGIAGGGRVAGLAGRLETNILRRAASVVVINDAFRLYARAAGVVEDRLHVVPNWSHVPAPTVGRAVTRRRLGWHENLVVALHSGNMGLKQGLDNVVSAARLAHERQERVRFVLMGEGSQRAHLEELGRDLPTLQFMAPEPSETFADVLAAADVLLVNERASAVDMSLPSKLTSYFAAGMPVVAAVPGLGGTAKEVQRSGAGLVVTPDDAAVLLDGVLGLAHDHDLLQVFRLAAHSHATLRLSAESSLRDLAAALLAPLSRASNGS